MKLKIFHSSQSIPIDSSRDHVQVCISILSAGRAKRRAVLGLRKREVYGNTEEIRALKAIWKAGGNAIEYRLGGGQSTMNQALMLERLNTRAYSAMRLRRCTAKDSCA
jgi:hypothetical protein